MVRVALKRLWGFRAECGDLPLRLALLAQGRMTGKSEATARSLRDDKSKNDQWLLLEGSSGLGYLGYVGVLRLRCAPLRMTGWQVAQGDRLQRQSKKTTITTVCGSALVRGL